MKVLLFDLDINKERNPFPNLALMKLSAYHKARGDEVFLNFPLCQPDLTYASCVFTWKAKGLNLLKAGIIKGGSGIDLTTELPPEVEHTMPDYHLYPNVDFSLGFSSRGCIRKCPPCIVPEKEGYIKAWARIYEFLDPRYKRLLLLDNNFLAAPNWQETMYDLIAEDLEVDINQGLDIRLLNEDNLYYLKKLRTKQLRFAFDHISSEPAVRQGIELLLKHGIPSRKLSFYVLIGFKDDETALDRMEILKSYKVSVYPMIFKGADGKEPILDLQSFSLEGFHGSRPNLRKFQRIISREGSTDQHRAHP